MIFQSYAVWPHMTVRENVGYGLKMQSMAAAERRARAEELLRATRLSDLGDRYPAELSGGQQQRVALARALAPHPGILLLDEPLSNLDANLRGEMRFEIRRLHDEYGNTSIYVTHDQSEALALSHAIAVMNGGRIEQIGTPREVYERPATPFVADFVGSTNFVPATVHGADGEAGFYRVRCEFGDLRAHGDGLAAGDKVMLSVRPEDVHLSEARPEGANVWEGTVDQKVFLGETVDFQIVINGRKLQSRAHPSLRTRVGESIFIRIDPEKCVALRGETK